MDVTPEPLRNSFVLDSMPLTLGPSAEYCISRHITMLRSEPAVCVYLRWWQSAHCSSPFKQGPPPCHYCSNPETTSNWNWLPGRPRGASWPIAVEEEPALAWKTADNWESWQTVVATAVFKSLRMPWREGFGGVVCTWVQPVIRVLWYVQVCLRRLWACVL